MFILKQIFARCFFPVPLVLEFLLLGLLFSFFKRTRLLGRVLVWVGFSLLFVFSLPPVGDVLLGSLEKRYDDFSYSALISDGETVSICVAGSGFDGENFNDDFLIRLQEAARISRILESKSCDYNLVVSIASSISDEVKLSYLNEYFESFGVPIHRIKMITSARNSAEEIAEFGKFSEKIILVSQAFHMPRLMQLSELNGILSIPVPAGNRVLGNKISALDFVPSADALDMTNTAFYEYLGMFENKVLVFLNSDF